MKTTGMTRRAFVKAVTVAGGTAGLSSRVRGAAKPASGSAPNILIILVDDLGYGDLSSYGAGDMRTPHVDELISEGMRFDRFYANCPVCSPTRASVLTGRYPDMVGVPGVVRTHYDNTWGYLRPDAKLLPALLKPAGYATAAVGKWHLGIAPPNLPNDRGFDVFHGYLGDMMDDYYTHRRHGINYMRRDRETIDPKGHATDLFSEWACDWLRKQKAGKPFCLYLAYNAPHTPIQPPDEWTAKVKQREKGIADKRAKLVALIEHMDDGIGRVLKTLEETGLDRDTLVIFTSDNGGQLSVGARNGDIRDGKGTLYEGGLRVPMCARWPGRTRPGSRSQRVALTMDLLPTVLAAAGVKFTHETDGVTFLPTLLGQRQAATKRDLFFTRREGGRKYGKEGYYIECIRRGTWKLFRGKPGGELELYNLADDPLEKTDRAKSSPEKFRELKTALDAQLKRYAAIPWRPPKSAGHILQRPATKK